MKSHKIQYVKKNSIADEVELEAGDELIAINGMPVEDALDYYYLIKSSYIELTIVKKSIHEEWVVEIEKEEYEDLGLVFENNLMDQYKSCTNKCIFCFIDQLPPGMRETLYFKDDDSRLSFLQGNYITLTNMKQKDVDRLIQYRMEPINISIHTMNMKLRKKMLGNRFADKLIDYMDQLYKANIYMNGQIVLCKGVNDREELEYSIEKLSHYLPYLQSVSVVPVGLSKYRDNLYPLEPFSKEDANYVIEKIERWQNILYEKYNNHFIHAGDELYFLADREMPKEETYDGYFQLENGVGMTRLLMNEFNKWYNSLEFTGNNQKTSKSIATGVLIAPLLEKLVDKITKDHPNIEVTIYPVINDFFGHQITVSGLLTGTDIINQLKLKDLGEELLLPSNLLKSGEEVLLDDITVKDIQEALNVPVRVVEVNGKELIQAILDKGVTK